MPLRQRFSTTLGAFTVHDILCFLSNPHILPAPLGYRGFMISRLPETFFFFRTGIPASWGRTNFLKRKGLVFTRRFFFGPGDQLDAAGVPEGGVPVGFSPDGRSPEGVVLFPYIPPGPPCGAVPFIVIPSGGVPEGAVPLAGISAGGVPDGAAFSEVPADACAEAAGVCSAGLDEAVVPESDVQPATRIPAMRNTDATSMIMVLLFMRYVSLVFREGSFPIPHLSHPLTVWAPPLLYSQYGWWEILTANRII